MKTFDFQDGMGQVPAHQHINPDGSRGGWVANTAKVSYTAYLEINATVFGHAWLSGEAHVFDQAQIYGNACVHGSTRISGHAQVCDQARVYGDAEVSGHAQICGESLVFGQAQIFGNAKVSGRAKVSGQTWVCGEAHIHLSELTRGLHAKSPPQVQLGRYPAIFDGEELRVGCLSHPLGYWIEHAEEIGSKYEATEDEVLLVKAFIASLLSQQTDKP